MSRSQSAWVPSLAATVFVCIACSTCGTEGGSPDGGTGSSVDAGGSGSGGGAGTTGNGGTGGEAGVSGSATGSATTGGGTGGSGGSTGGLGGSGASTGGSGGSSGGSGGSSGGSGGSGGAASGTIPCRTAGQSCSASEPCCFGLNCAGGCVMFVSDRNLKRDFAPVDEDKILQSLVELPISTWRYTSDTTNARHIGPMAQDFEAKFQVGASDKLIHPVDGNGVALAAIKALNARLNRLAEENAALRRELEKMRAGRNVP